MKLIKKSITYRLFCIIEQRVVSVQIPYDGFRICYPCCLISAPSVDAIQYTIFPWHPGVGLHPLSDQI